MVTYVSEFGFGFLNQVTVAVPEDFADAREQTVTGLAGGGYVISYQIGSSTFLRLYGPDGAPRGVPIQVADSFISDVEIAALPGGGFVMVWVGDPVEVKARFFDASGTATSAVIAIDGTNNREQQPDVTVLEDGGVLVAWRANTATPAILARVLEQDGTFASGVFTVSQTDGPDVFFPQITALEGGGYVVSWAEIFDRIAAQVYNAANQPVGSTIAVPEAAEYLGQRFQSVGALPGGGFVMVWNEVDFASTDRILAAIYSAEGVMIGTPFAVNSDTSFNTSAPDLTVLDDGTFMVAWRLEVPGNGPNFFQIGDIRARRFGADGQPLGAEFAVNDGTGEGQLSPRITAFGTGDVAITWVSFPDDSTNSEIQLRNLYSVTSGSAAGESMNGTDGVDFLRALDGVDWLTGGPGNDVLDGGANVDTAVVSGTRAQYTVTQTSTGVFQVVGPDGADTLTAVEFLQFDDQTIRLLPGTGVSVNFETADPAVYQSAMNAIRDFDGNALGGNGSWLRIGSADVNGDGDVDQILVNRAIGRFATVGTAPDGLVYFSDFSWAGETRIAGIYIDPLVAAGIVERFGPNDSQRRFQNDLQIENINRVLGADDYDNDGLQEVYFALTDGTAYLRAIMEFDGNIRYANYQSQQEVIDYLTTNGFGPETYAGWFTAPSSGEASMMQQRIDLAEASGLGRAELVLRPGLDNAVTGMIDHASLASHAPALDDHLRPEFYG